ncbi:MAG: DUF1501 domain-containing protein [Myxococcales bacterium]|jgi:hypothetical protein
MTRRHRKNAPLRTSRRGFLKAAGATSALAAAGALAPHVWLKNPAIAQTSGRGVIKHLLYVRLSGGFRFPVAFNADVAPEFNPFGSASGVAEGAEWGVGELLARADYLDGDEGQALRDMGVRSVPEIADRIAVLPCVDHEPLAASADGNHGTGLERYYTGYVGGTVGFFTMINYGLRERVARAAEEGQLLLPAFVLGGSGMGRGVGVHAAHRPPVLSGSGFDRFQLDTDRQTPEWAEGLAAHTDERMRDRQHAELRGQIEAYMETRKATQAYAEIFNSDALKIDDNRVADDPIDGITNAELRSVFGGGRTSRDVRLALRLFHFGSPAVYIDQGGYDMHSGEEGQLPGRMVELNRMLSGLEAVLQRMEHPDGGSYWDHTAVVLGSEFSRTARGRRFNSARGSDHGGDHATRWMSMPFMGGPFDAVAGRRLGQTRASDLRAEGQVYSYRSVLKTLLDGLGADHAEFFPGDQPFEDLFV